ncbi:MAG: thermonuclease family protein [Patescibacteria group bacterium]
MSRLRPVLILAIIIIAIGVGFLVFLPHFTSLLFQPSSTNIVATSTSRMDEDVLTVLQEDDALVDDELNADDVNQIEPVADETNATVVHVIDGDTLDAEIDGLGTFRIRMLGADTPEVVDPRKPVQCFGEEASAFSKKTLAVGLRIRLAPDPNADERDKYGRLLRNVFLKDGTDYNAFLVEQGYAHAYTYFPLTPSRKVQLIRLEREAKEAGRGLWGECE